MKLKHKFAILASTASMAALVAASPVLAQGAQPDTAASDDNAATVVVVTGIRNSLASAEAIKRNSDQVVDSIVANDIGKFPDRTVAAALQRVPGVQVSIGGNDEIVSPLVRGLSDILTTVDGREAFTGTSRSFNFQDIPAEALGGADVYKSNAANLIEGGVAGTIALKFRKPLDFKTFTIGGSVTASYSDNAGKTSPAINAFVADRWTTGAGDVGLLVTASYSHTNFEQGGLYSESNASGDVFPTNAPVGSRAEGGMLSPSYGSYVHSGYYSRPFLMGTLQWRPDDSLELYLQGMYAGTHTKYATDYAYANAAEASSIENVVIDSNSCNDYLVGANGYYSPTGTQQHLCRVASYTAHDFHAFVGSHGDSTDGGLYLFATGAKYNGERLHVNFDVSYQHSRYENHGAFFDIGKMVDTVNVVSNNGDDVPTWNLEGNPLADPTGFAFTNGLNISDSIDLGKQFAVAADAIYDLDGFFKNIQFGFRAADRTADRQEAQVNAGPPGGAYATPVTALGMGDSVYFQSPSSRWVDGGQSFAAIDPDLLLDRGFQDKLKALYGVPTGVAPYDPTRGFHGEEKNYAGYVQGKYQFALGAAARVDGLVGLRITRTDRSINGTGTIIAPDPAHPGSTITVLNPVSRDTSDTDYLPNASARVVLTDKLQARFSYAEAIARPDFSSLNPGLSYALSSNPAVPSGGSAGNPDLRPQKSKQFDATLEYYFGRNTYASVGVFDKQLKDRVVNQQLPEVIDGANYLISRPRNVGEAGIKGIEVSGQMFADFLPGFWSGFGVLGNFTYLDSQIKSPGDPLYGYDLLGVAKYNYNAGLLYEKARLSARLIYTYKGKYYDGDGSAGGDLRPISLGTAFLYAEQPTGRLDLSVNYDLTPHVTVSLDGTNLTGAHSTRSRFYAINPGSADDWDTAYIASVRFKY